MRNMHHQILDKDPTVQIITITRATWVTTAIPIKGQTSFAVSVVAVPRTTQNVCSRQDPVISPWLSDHWQPKLVEAWTGEGVEGGSVLVGGAAMSGVW